MLYVVVANFANLRKLSEPKRHPGKLELAVVFVLFLVPKDGFKSVMLLFLPKEEFCPIIAGISFLDQVRSLESFSVINFEKIAYPLLFLPFVSRASEIIGKKIKLKIDNKVFLLNFNNSIYSNSLNEGIIERGNIVSVNFEENKDSFEEEEWKNLYKLSENTFVEESESLKVAGAGAGLTDND